MFNVSVEFPSDRSIMRPIKKSVPLQLDAFATWTCGGASSPLLGSQTIFKIDQTTVFEFNNFEYEHALTTSMRLRPSMCLVAKSSKSILTEVPQKHDTIPKINEFAVRLDDIEPCWHATEEDREVFKRKKVVHKDYDDVSLDFFAIQREAQKYNDCGELHRKLDVFFMQAMQKHMLGYMGQMWPYLTYFQRCILIDMARHKCTSVFDHITWFGYDSVLKATGDEPTKVIEYQNIVNSILGTKSDNFVKGCRDIVVDFGINFGKAKLVVDACDKHFTRTVRKRMAYTKQFGKIANA